MIKSLINLIPPVVVPVAPPIAITKIKTAIEMFVRLESFTVENPVLVIAETTVKSESSGSKLEVIAITNAAKKRIGIDIFV